MFVGLMELEDYIVVENEVDNECFNVYKEVDIVGWQDFL